MKIAVAIKENKLDAEVDPRFGRCAYFLLYDTEGESQTLLENPAASASGGAGTQAAQWLADQGVEIVIASEFGPKAQRALDLGDLKAYHTSGETSSKAIEAFLQGHLQPASTSGGHGRGRGRGRGRRGG
ncbi:MAG: NifB/NifX family molybdenum-iron cluster-binding protein [Anaerolineales bacterium]|jgi:predicted Fe-Mo cluster-binding NifX family protein